MIAFVVSVYLIFMILEFIYLKKKNKKKEARISVTLMILNIIFVILIMEHVKIISPAEIIEKIMHTI